MRCGEPRLRSHWMVVENSTRAPVFASKARLACLACTKLWQTHLPTKKVSCCIQELGKTAFSGMQANDELSRAGQGQGLEHRRITWMFTTGLVRVGLVGSFFRIPLWIFSRATAQRQVSFLVCTVRYDTRLSSPLHFHSCPILRGTRESQTLYPLLLRFYGLDLLHFLQ